FVARRHHATAMALLQFGDAAGVVAVVMRHEDVGELPAGLLERSLDRRRFGRVDGGGGAARLVVHEHAVIVLQATEEMSFRRHAGTLQEPAGDVTGPRVPIPKFANLAAPSWANFGIKGTRARIYFRCPEPEVRSSDSRRGYANFAFGAPRIATSEFMLSSGPRLRTAGRIGHFTAMSLDVVDLRNFYGQPLGIVARRFVGRGIRRRWPDLRAQRVVGIGYATPYLGLFREEAERCLAFMPAAQGVVKWPTARPTLAALVEETELPLVDAAVDRVLIVHGLEMAEDVFALLREAWRVLPPPPPLPPLLPTPPPPSPPTH